MHQRELWATYIRLAVHRSMFWRRREGDEEGGCRGGGRLSARRTASETIMRESREHKARPRGSL